MRRRTNGPLAALAVLAASAAAFATGALAFRASTVGAVGKTVQQVVVRAGVTNGLTISSTSYSDVPGAVAKVVVATGTRGLVVARFSGESSCSYAQPAGVNNPCLVRILIGNVEGEPSGDYAFDWDLNAINTQGFSFAPTRSLERDAFRSGLPAGTYLVRVQWRVPTAALRFRINRWSLIIESIKM
jgi:hypothetical protein